jgi:DegV family protein with EDD domain
MSGTYNALVQYAKDHPRVSVFDSKLNSGAEGLVVLLAAKLVEENKSVTEFVNELNEFAKKTKIYVSVKTLKYMVKQGRVSKLVGFAAKLMNLKPVVGIDENGKGEITRKAMSLRGNVVKSSN